MAWKGKLGKFRVQHLAKSSFPNMLEKRVPELSAEENHAKRVSEKAPDPLLSVAKHVPGNTVAKSYWVNSRLL